MLTTPIGASEMLLEQPPATIPLWGLVGPSALGWFVMLADDRGVQRLSFGQRSADDALAVVGGPQVLSAAPLVLSDEGEVDEVAGLPDGPDWLHSAGRLVQQLLAGDPVDLSPVPLSLPLATAFQQRVRAVVRELAYGQVASYGQIAARVGRPGAARAVGTVMSNNPVPLLIPCHRVLGSGGKLGGYSMAAGLATKRQLLDLEQAAGGRTDRL